MLIATINIYGQNKNAFNKENYKPLKNLQEVTETEISRSLVLNLKEDIFSDSVALYTFAISIKGKMKKHNFNILELTTNDSLCYKAFPKLDSLIKDINLSVFVNKKGVSYIIIPIAIVLTAHDKIPKNSTINVWDLPKRLNILFDSMRTTKYQSVYLSPKTIMVDNQIYQ